MTQSIGFGPTKRPCTARTRLFRLINAQNGSLCPLHAASLLISPENQQKSQFWKKIHERVKASLSSRIQLQVTL